MSFDLFFRPKTKSVPPEEFNRYFQSRKNYECTENNVTYVNEITGVYFHFSLTKPEDKMEKDEPDLSFNMNLFRPHPFALEAEPEVFAFISHFNLAIEDPQTNGMGKGEYSSLGFIESWNSSNEFAYAAMIARDDSKQMYTLPSKTIELIWRWNLNSEKLQADLGNNIFVPRYFLCVHKELVKSFIVWGDGIPIALPRTDLLFLARERTSPKKSAGVIVPTNAIVKYEEVEPLLDRFALQESVAPYKKLDYREEDPKIDSFFKQCNSFCDIDELQQITFDHVLDAEIVERVKVKIRK